MRAYERAAGGPKGSPRKLKTITERETDAEFPMGWALSSSSEANGGRIVRARQGSDEVLRELIDLKRMSFRESENTGNGSICFEINLSRKQKHP